jgi:LytS/YehU family sensor histidine kinase
MGPPDATPLNFGVTTKLIATAFALCGFIVAIIAGLSAGNSAGQVLSTAIVCMIGCQFAGLLAGAIGERTVHEHLSSYRKSVAPAESHAEPAQKSSPLDVSNP